MKKWVSLVVVLVLMVSTLSMAGCAKKEKAEGDQLARIQAAGKLIIGTEGTWAPWTYHDENDKLVGFDVEVAQHVAEKLGVEAVFEECAWDSIFAGIDSGRYDLTANGVEATADRAEKYEFSEPYAYIRTALIVREDNTDITTFEDLNGRTSTNSAGSTYATLAESYGATTTIVDSLDETLDMVLAGRVDATLNADVSFYDYMGVHPDAQLKVVALTEEASNVIMPIRKGEDSATLLEAVNKAINELREEGVLAELSVKYFGSDITTAQ